MSDWSWSTRSAHIEDAMRVDGTLTAKRIVLDGKDLSAFYAAQSTPPVCATTPIPLLVQPVSDELGSGATVECTSDSENVRACSIAIAEIRGELERLRDELKATQTIALAEMQKELAQIRSDNATRTTELYNIIKSLQPPPPKSRAKPKSSLL